MQTQNNKLIKKKSRKHDHQNSIQLLIFRISKSPLISQTVPLHEIVNYGFWDRVVVAGAASFVVRDYRMNSVWQPVVGGATGTLSAYNSSAFRYAIYRALRYALKIQVTCNESFGVSCGVVFSDTQPSTVITTYALALKSLMSSNTGLRGTLGYSTGPGKFVSKLVKTYIADVVGDPLNYYASDNYVATLGTPLIAVPVAGTNPAQTVWASFVVVSDGPGQNLTNGVFLDWQALVNTLNYSVRIDA